MRISDWSSDVCSSDLDPRSGLAEAGRLTRDGEVAQQVQLVPHADARAPHPTDDRLGTETESREPVEGDLHGRRFDPHRTVGGGNHVEVAARSEEHTSELQSLMRISYAGFCLKKKKQQNMKC